MTLLAHQTEQNWAAYHQEMGSLSPGISTGVILHEAVMPTSHSQGAAGITGGGAGWNSPYMSIINNVHGVIYKQSGLLIIYTSKFHM